MNNSCQCARPDWYTRLGDDLVLVNWTLLPLFLFIGLIGHGVSLRAFRRQANKEKAYTYQQYLAIVEIIHLLVFTILLSILLCSISTGPIGIWFHYSYTLVFILAHLAVPLANSLAVVKLFLSISMATDRVLACAKPFYYKNINHNRHRLVATIFSILIGFGTQMHNVNAYVMRWENGTYQYDVNLNYVGSNLGLILTYISNIIRLIGLIFLLGSNFALIHFYRKRFRITPVDTGSVVIPRERVQYEANKRKEERKMKERDLMILAISQSCFTSASVLGYVTMTTLYYTSPTFPQCDSNSIGGLLNMVSMICDMADAVTIVMINRKARDIITMAMKCKTGIGSTVTPARS